LFAQVSSPFKNSPRLQSFFQRQNPNAFSAPSADVSVSTSVQNDGAATAQLSAFDTEFTPRVLSFDADSNSSSGGDSGLHRHKAPRLEDPGIAGCELTRDPVSVAHTSSESAATEAQSDSTGLRACALKLPATSSQAPVAPVCIPSLKLDLSRSSTPTHEDSETKQRGESPALNLSLLQKLGITHIVNCAADTTACAFEDTGRFKYLRVHINDSVNDGVTSHIPAVFAFLDECLSKPEGRCLIHCTQGVSRSVSFCVAREMADRNCDYDVALATIKSQRAVAAPNAGYTSLI
jgi:predicted protein tyrosine phosphatase